MANQLPSARQELDGVHDEPTNVVEQADGVRRIARVDEHVEGSDDEHMIDHKYGIKYIVDDHEEQKQGDNSSEG